MKQRDGLETDGREPFQIQFSKKKTTHAHTILKIIN